MFAIVLLGGYPILEGCRLSTVAMVTVADARVFQVVANVLQSGFGYNINILF